MTRIWIPNGYGSSRTWPAILFLHGAGERGDDDARQMTVGLGPHLDALQPPAIVIFPQCPLGRQWRHATPLAMSALDDACNDYPIDADRVSLTGISMGGAGAWALAVEHPTRWSALAPVCGWYAGMKPIPTLPTWIFHGDADTTINVEESRRMAARLGHARYTEFPGVGHNSWDLAYGTTDVVAWLVSQRRA